METIISTENLSNSNSNNENNLIKTTNLDKIIKTTNSINSNFNKLPLNLIESIINFSLINLNQVKIKTYSYYKQRYRTLKKLSLINREFLKLSNQLLYTNLYFNNPLSLNLLLKLDSSTTSTTTTNNNNKLLLLTKSLKIGDANLDKSLFDKYILLIHKILMRLPNLHQLEIHNVEGLDICMLSWGVEIRELTLDNVVFKQTKAQSYETDVLLWHLPSLTHLYIDSISYINFNREFISTSYLLNRLSLPKLSTLTYQYSNETSSPSLDSIAPSLKSLFLYRFIDESNKPTPSPSPTIIKDSSTGIPLNPQPQPPPPPPPPAPLPIHYPLLPDLKELNNLEHLSLDFRYLNDITTLQNLNCSPRTVRISSDQSDHTLNVIELNPLFKDLNNGGNDDDNNNSSSSGSNSTKSQSNGNGNGNGNENGNGNRIQKEEQINSDTNNSSRVFGRLELVIVPQITKFKEGRIKTREFCEKWFIDLKEVIYDSFEEGREIVQWMNMTDQN